MKIEALTPILPRIFSQHAEALAAKDVARGGGGKRCGLGSGGASRRVLGKEDLGASP